MTVCWIFSSPIVTVWGFSETIKRHRASLDALGPCPTVGRVIKGPFHTAREMLVASA